jgi:hypothetical protein
MEATMFTEINAFGTIHKAGEPARVSFDDNFTQVDEERGAAFVLEFTLGPTGVVLLRQAGASRREGLVLHLVGPTFNEAVPIKIGQHHDLTQRRLQSSMVLIEVRLPGKSAVLSFKHKCFAGNRKAFSLSWSAKG